MIAVMITGGVIALLNATGRASAEERHRSQAYAIAQEDQARLRAMRIPSLNGFVEKEREVPLNGTIYKVTSTAKFVNDSTGEAPTCSSGSASVDYVRISTTVTWPSRGSRPPVNIESIVSPVSGSLDPTHGNLSITTINAAGLPLPAVPLTLTGPATLASNTDSSGCAIFYDQPAGDYTVTPSPGAGYVEKDGNAPQAETVSAAAGSTTNYVLQFDKAGSAPVAFKYRVGSSGTFNAGTADSIYVFNSNMSSAKVFGTPGGTRQTGITATSLFPFTSTYAVYAGSCEGDNPNPTGVEPPPAAAAPALANVSVPVNGTAATATLQLPALNLKVWTGRNSSNPESAYNGADVWIRDDYCPETGTPVTRRATTNSSGNLPDPGLPWSRYDVCADTITGGATTGGRRQRIENVEVKNLTSGTTINFYLGSASGSGTIASESGQCP